jgi:hypothetical protein
MPPEGQESGSGNAGQGQQGSQSGDSSARLERLERENARLVKALEKRELDEKAAQEKASAAEREAAAKKGEWEKLYGEEKAKGSSLAEQLKTERERREGYERLLNDRVDSALKGIEDKELKKKWESAMDGLSPDAKLRTLDALLETAGRSAPNPTPRPGAPGKSKILLDKTLLAGNGPASETARRDLALKILRERKGS